MSQASNQVLAFLRTLIEKRGLNTAALAAKSQLSRARLRRVLTGAEPMTVDELLAISTALEVSPSDLGLPAGTAAEEDLPAIAVAPAATESADGDRISPVVDPYGNHPEQLLRVGFALGCDLLFLAESEQLSGSGLPESVLQQYRQGAVPIKLDAAYHMYNTPRYSPEAFTITLSFDTLYECRFPWSSIRQVVFFPAPVEPPAVEGGDTPTGRGPPRLRLVE